MAPPIFALLLFLAVVVVAIVGALWAVRAGLWARETSASGDGDIEMTGRGRRRARRQRPDHLEVEDPADSRFIDT